MSSIEDLLPEYVLGTLPRDQRQEVDRWLARSPSLQRELDQTAQALALAAARALEPISPPASLRRRLMATVRGPERFAPFMAALTRLFELPEATIRSLLARADGERAGWETALDGVALHGTELFHFQVGPGLTATGAAGGVLRMRPGAVFPAHSHGGEETSFILEGACQTDAGVGGPGTLMTMPGGTSHAFSASPDRPLLLMVLHRGISLHGDDAGRAAHAAKPH